MTYRIIITGSRDWIDRERIAEAMSSWVCSVLTIPGEIFDPPVVVHGAARGADMLADEIALGWGWLVERHYPRWDLHDKAAGPIRNQEMVDIGADVCLAFPIGNAKGTRDCMRRAARAGIPVISHEQPTKEQP